ncbi:hypothetical protein QWY75_03725 [Pontixanthobacter aestiaquae]|uniref:Uncharacterized protein n=1 Tax=Pontixanthobacter aestiaquae TaxID=1509367 RepID=A0A844Z9K5_9SPHN|nr:hypothetical protein [Pontixanthobacter aestiaquae]MDN3645316.1 hypothetical protein [Pontixanthobacter aestiaquae]MXO83683.1 hypothetical protein [Pontixanthobacter aestiaquae]
MKSASTLIAGVAVVLAAPLAAQSAPPSVPKRFEIVQLPKVQERENPRAIPSDTMRIMQKKFARCVYRRHREEADSFLQNSDYVQADLLALGLTKGELYRSFSAQHCMRLARTRGLRSFSVDMPVKVMRRILVEEAYLANAKKPLQLDQSGPEFLDRDFVGGQPTTQAKAMTMFGDCIVFADISKSDALLRTSPESTEESVAIQNLLPAMSACIAEGADVELTAERIRAVVAEGLYARQAYHVQYLSQQDASQDGNLEVDTE